MEEMKYRCCFTGYRPQKFPFSLKNDCAEYINFENLLTEKILELIENGCTGFITGMAEGFDIIAAETVLTLKEIYKDANITLICAVPFPAQAESFKDDWKLRYDNVLEKSDDMILISEKYYPGCFIKRNIFMVDNSDFVIAYYDGKKGGTQKTVDYAEKKGRQVINLYQKNGD